MDKWQIYDELIGNIPTDYTVEYCFVSPCWIGVKSEAGLGLAMRMDAPIITKLVGKIKGMKLHELASYSKSWDFHEAALGLAAINSYYNGKDTTNPFIKRCLKDETELGIFDLIKDKVKDKKVTVVGHFPNLEKLRELCTLTILERKPNLLRFDTPDPACEYVLPYQDFLFTTAVTLTNKTLPRLLELSQNADIHLVGPTTPMTDILFKYNIKCLSGSIVMNPSKATELFVEGCTLHHVIDEKCVHMVNIYNH